MPLNPLRSLTGSLTSLKGRILEDCPLEEGGHHQDHHPEEVEEAEEVEEVEEEEEEEEEECFHYPGKHLLSLRKNSLEMHPQSLQVTEQRWTPSSHSGNCIAVSMPTMLPSETNIRR